jgi:Na+-driven multidrug efflux pump
MLKKNANPIDKNELFANTPVPKALRVMAVPTIISQLVNLIHNMVDAFFIGRTGNAYMMAATSITLTLVLMNVALANLFGTGGGSLMARLMGAGKPDRAKRVSAYSVYGAILAALVYSALVGIFNRPLLRFLGASDATFGYARSYAMVVIVMGSLPSILSMALGHLLRNAGHSGKASFGLSGGGILNMLLDPLFMFVLLPPGNEVLGAAIATALSNAAACVYLLIACRRAGKESSPLSLNVRDAAAIEREDRKGIFAVGIPSAVLLALFDLANVCVNILASGHDDLVLAGMGIVMKVERIPNAMNVGLCMGMLPIVAYNYSSGNRARMEEPIRTARKAGLLICLASMIFFEIVARPAVGIFLHTGGENNADALRTVAYAALFLRIRCLASPFQFLNYHTSYGLQAMGKGRATLLHAFVREIIFYIPCMFLLDHLFGETGLAAALPAGEALGAVFAIWLMARTLRKLREARKPA